ncbi:MAG: NTP transferase domain-containing protein [Candidatus Diapherotrites archaeon]|uniref:NTP transferase domain-containing protein n=1 Tax=Candidatus Iainarchaeum sp. TaxID=3101447 RepID=A0A8T4KY57_9ARCH|nr:NTP transferase domain-containing protein [Candidatus Diapherotrites archaeon]
MNEKLKALVLAAGKGIRMLPVTDEIPKAMVEIAGKPILERILDVLGEAGIKEVVIVVGYKKGQIMEYFGNEFRGMKIDYAVQEKQLGTAHAIGMARQFMQGDFISINGDLLFESSLIKELAGKSGFDAVIVGRKVQDLSRFAALEIEDGLVKNIIEKPRPGETKTDIINYGIYRFSKKIFDVIARTGINPIRNEYEITDSLKLMLNEGAEIACLLYNGFRIDISNSKDLEEANRMLKN